MIEGKREYNDRCHIEEDSRMYSIHSVEKCISELLKSGVDKSIIQKVFSSSFKVFLIMHDQ